MARSAVLERAGLDMLADEEAPAENVVHLWQPQSARAAAVGICSDFERFLADLKAEVEQPLLGALVQDLRAILSKLKRQAPRVDADQGRRQAGQALLEYD